MVQNPPDFRRRKISVNYRIVAVGQKEFQQFYPQPGWVEHDPMEIWATQYGVLQEALAKADITMADVAAKALLFAPALWRPAHGPESN